MPADLAEAVRSMPCEACQAPRGGYCSCEGTHLARWELAAASALVSQQEYHAAARAARPAPPGFPPGLAVVPELSGVVCTAAGHPLRWDTGTLPSAVGSPGPAGRDGLCRPGRAPPGPRGTVPLPPPSLVTARPGRGSGGPGPGLPAVRPQAGPPGAVGLTTRTSPGGQGAHPSPAPAVPARRRAAIVANVGA